MKLLLVAATAAVAALLAADSSDALFLGQGGVFNSKEAQQSFNSRFDPDVFRAARLAGRSFKASSSVAAAPAKTVINYGVSPVQPAAATIAVADLENAIAGSTAPIFEPEPLPAVAPATVDAVTGAVTLPAAAAALPVVQQPQIQTTVAASAPVVYYYVPTFEGTVAPPSPYWALTQDGVPVLINAVVNTV